MYYLDHSNKFLDEYTEKETSFLSELPFIFSSIFNLVKYLNNNSISV
jgi:hypothetical protein